MFTNFGSMPRKGLHDFVLSSVRPEGVCGKRNRFTQVRATSRHTREYVNEVATFRAVSGKNVLDPVSQILRILLFH